MPAISAFCGPFTWGALPKTTRSNTASAVIWQRPRLESAPIGNALSTTRKLGDVPDARDGVYYTGTPGDPDDPSENRGAEPPLRNRRAGPLRQGAGRMGSVDPRPQVCASRCSNRNRVDRLRGSILADKVSAVLLPGFGRQLPVWTFQRVRRSPPGAIRRLRAAR